MKPVTGRSSRRFGALVVLGAALVCVLVAAAAGGRPQATEGPIAAKDYDLGVRRFPEPQTGRFSSMPIRLWGTVAVPKGSGPHPVVVVAHGAHGDGCPGEYGTWPCWDVEQRNDLGFRWLVQALARAGFVAVAPDVNAAYTGGWGESAIKEPRRFGEVVDAVLAELALGNAGAPTRLGVPLRGKVDLSRVGLLGHSRGGMNVLGWAKHRGNVRSVFLVAPFHDAAKRIPNVPATVLLGTCDGDTGLSGAKYVSAARQSARTRPVYQLTLGGANHNYYNQTLVSLKADDSSGSKLPGCADGARLGGAEQQSFLGSVAVDHFAASLLGAPTASWMQGPVPTELYGQRVAVKRVNP